LDPKSESGIARSSAGDLCVEADVQVRWVKWQFSITKQFPGSAPFWRRAGKLLGVRRDAHASQLALLVGKIYTLAGPSRAQARNLLKLL
jgi:hypothetical protein